MIHLGIFLIACLGFAALMLAMPRHQQDWFGRKLPESFGRMLRIFGFAMLLAAFVIAGAMTGWGYGTVLWFGWLTIAAALVVTINTNRIRLQGALVRKEC